MTSCIFLYSAAGIFMAYTISVFAMFGVLPSLSESHYRWKEKDKRLSFVFPSFIFIMSILLVPYWFDHSSENTLFLILFASFSFLLVAAAPLFKGYQRKTHFTGAIMCAAATLLWMILNGHSNIPLWWLCAAIVAICIFGRRTWLLWLEIAAFVSLFNTHIYKHLTTI